MKRIRLLVTVMGPYVLGGCASHVSQAEVFGVSIPRPAATSVRAANKSAKSVWVAPDVLQQWSFLYLAIDENEFALCLEGTVEGQQVRIENFRLARIRASAMTAVDFKVCENDRYIGMAHNHPRPKGTLDSPCYFSEADKRTFLRDKRAEIDVVICGETNFVWTSKEESNPLAEAVHSNFSNSLDLDFYIR